MTPIHNYIKLKDLGYDRSCSVYVGGGLRIFGKFWSIFMVHDWVDKSVI